MGSELNKALAAFQANMPSVPKAAEADTGVYKFDYAPLDAITDKAMPLLGKHGLAYICLPGADGEGRLVLDYALLHESGEEKTGQFPLWLVLPEKFKAQTIGGLITYFRRYCLLAVTGIAPGGEDDDAAASTEVVMERPARQRPQRPPSRPTATPVHTATTGADHERLRYGTVEATPDDHPAERGPLPTDQDPWAGKLPEELPGSADPGDVQAIQIAYGKLKFNSRTDRAQLLNISEKLTGRDLTGPNPGRTHNNLTGVEAKELKGILAGFKGDRGKLMERLTGITQAVAEVAAQDAAEGTQDDGGSDG